MEEIDELLKTSATIKEQALKLCLIKIEKMAREVISKNKKLKSFTMAMGTHFFSFENEIAYDFEDKEFEYFIKKYDEIFDYTLKGNAMHFTEKGEVITDW